MVLPKYIFHYNVPPTEFSLNCGHLLGDILGRRQDPPLNTVRREDPPDGVSESEVSDEDDEDILIANLNDSQLWETVSLLRWGMATDRVISGQELAADLALLKIGTISRIRSAVRQLIAALTAKYPALGRVGYPTLVQLIALGRDMATSAGESPDLLEFVKKEELQAVNLAAALRV